MSNLLAQKLKKIAYQRKENEIQRIISVVPGVTWIAWAEDENSSKLLRLIWTTIVNVNSVPSTRISNTAFDTNITQWLIKCLNQSLIKDQCYLSVGGSEMPWALIEIPQDNEWFLNFWDILSETSLTSAKNFAIASSDQSEVLGFFEEEYYYRAFHFQVSHKPEIILTPI